MSIMSVPFDLALFDLEPRDIKVYEAMLSSSDGLSIRTLAAMTNLNRGTTFEIIKKLQRLGLISSHYRLSRKYYAAQDPSFLQKYAEERYQTMGHEITKVHDYATELQKMQALESFTQFSQVYEGEDEIALLLHDVLDTVAVLSHKQYQVISSAEVSNHMYSRFENFTKQRIRRGIAVQVLGIGGSDSLAALAERKWLATDEVPACYIIIYGSKVAQIYIGPQGNIQGSVTDNHGIAALYNLLFKTMWNAL